MAATDSIPSEPRPFSIRLPHWGWLLLATVLLVVAARHGISARLNHLFMHVDGKSTPENTLKAGHVDEQVVEEIAMWVKAASNAK